MSKYDFGNDDIGKVLNEHFRVEERFPGIHVCVPYKEMPQNLTAGQHAPRSPIGQVKIICEAVKRGASLGYWKTAMWDTVTNTAYAAKNQVAAQKVNKDDMSKHYTVGLGENFLFNVPGVNWRDNGMAQDLAYYTIRDGLLTAPEPFNMFFIGHEVTKDELGICGFDAGGPASAQKFPAGQFQAFFHLIQENGKRAMMTRKWVRRGVECYALYKVPPGTPLPSCINDKGAVLIPENDFAGCVEIWRQLKEHQGARHFRCAVWGASDAGKSAMVSAFLGLPGTKDALVIMSDNQADLPSFWPQVKQSSDQPESSGANL